MIFRRKTIYKAKSKYGSYKVVDMKYNGRPSRVLFGDQKTAQSGLALDDEPELLFDYNQRFLEMMISRQPMQKALIIGGGAGILPTAAYYQFPTLSIDSIEIDPLLTQIAYKYFDLPHDHRLQVHAKDGAGYVAKTNQKYDMICLDAFSGYTIPPHLLKLDTVKHYKQCLKSDGFIAVNFISEYRPYQKQLAHNMLEIFGKIFDHVSLYQADPHEEANEDQNFILVASNTPISFDYLQSTEREIY